MSSKLHFKSTKSPSPNLPANSPPDSNPTLLSVHDVVRPSTTASSYENAGHITLELLKDILEAVDTLPCVKYVAGVSIKILDIVDEVQTNKEDMYNIGLRAGDMIAAVAIACKRAGQSLEKELENDLSQFTRTLNDILALTEDLRSRKWHEKVLRKMDDATAVKTLDGQLTQAFRIFEIQSNVSIRIAQQKVFDHIMYRSPLVKDCPLRIPEGIYIIQNALDDRVIEAEHIRMSTERRNTHIYLGRNSRGSSPYQLWSISGNSGKTFEYTVQNVGTGVVLDIFCSRSADGTQVIGHSNYWRPWQLWSFYASRESHSDFDYCTIRSYGPPTIVDARCVASPACEYLHMWHLSPNGPSPSQEWSLIRLPTSTSPRSSLISAASSNGDTGDFFTRRRFLLQNVGSGGYAAVDGLQDTTDELNVTIEPDKAAATTWFFVHTTKEIDHDAHEDMFAIAAGEPPLMGTLDFWGQQRIVVSSKRFWPGDWHHMWKVLPRDGAFTFKNFATGRLLCQARGMEVIDTDSLTAFNRPSCQWRLVDASSGETCRVLYDSMLSVVPPELAGTPPKPIAVQESIRRLTLRTENASPELVQGFINGFEYQHDLIREMLKIGYTSLVVAPLKVIGWREGRISSMETMDEESSFGLPKIRAAAAGFQCR